MSKFRLFVTHYVFAHIKCAIVSIALVIIVLNSNCIAYLINADGVNIDSGKHVYSGVWKYENYFLERFDDPALSETGACYGFSTIYKILNAESREDTVVDYYENYVKSCVINQTSSAENTYLSYIDCSTCRATTSYNNPSQCTTYNVDNNQYFDFRLNFGSYKRFYNKSYDELDGDGKWMYDKCNLNSTGSVYRINTSNKIFKLKFNKQGSSLTITGNLNIKNNDSKPIITDFTINGIKPKIIAYTYDKYIKGFNYYELSADVEWNIPVSAHIGETIILQPDLAVGYGDFVINSIRLKKPICSLSIASLTGTNTILNPASGGSIGFSGTITEESGQAVSWTLEVLGKTIPGSGNSVKATWDGKLPDGTVVKPGSYSATLTATTADGQCTDSKTTNFTVTAAPDGQCGLYVDFGSSAHLSSGNLSHSQNLFSSRGNSLPLGLTLYYNSLDPANNTLGRGWSHSYSYNLKENSDGSVLISEPNWRYKYYTAGAGGYSSSTGNYAVLAKDANGFSLTERDGTLYRYTGGGQLVSITDRNGNSQTFSYTGNNLTSVIDPAGRTVSFNYDGANHLTSISDPLGNSYTLGVGTTLNVVTQPDSSTWQYSYDANGFMLGKVDPLGNSFSYSYDDQHRVTGSTDPEGKTRSISYPQGTETIKNTTFTEKDGSSWSYSYDTQKGYLLSKTDPQSGTTSYQYDANGNRSATTNPDGTSTSALYDGLGSMLSSTDAAGAVTSYSYNSFGQVTTVTDPANATTRYGYDDKGNLTSLTDVAGATTSYEYDSKGNMSRVTDAAGQSSSFSYDAAGNMTSVTDASGATTRYSYDASGNVISITDAKGGVTSFSYDSRGRLIKSINPQGNATSYSYDKNGNKLSATDANNNTTRYEYNSRNQLIKTIDALGNSTVYSYGASSCPSCGGGVDKLTALSDANNNVTRYDYDSLGRLIKETDPLGKITSYHYDSKGNLIAKTDAKGNTINYSYDANSRLLKKSYPDNTEETFSYDAKGNILTAANKNISYSFSYDLAGRMLSSSDSNGNSISYSYDAAGRKTRTVYPDGSKVSYGYDTAGRLASITDQHNNRFSLTYSSLGQRTQLGYPNGVVTGYAYDASGNLTRLNHQSHGRPVSTFSYTHDKVGNRLSKTELFRTTSYHYDGIYRLITAQINRRAAEQYSYDPVGNRLTGPEQGTDYRYGIGNQLLQQEQTGYSYDDNGNLAQRSISRSRHSHHCEHHNQPWNYRFDYENRLIEADNGDITVSFSYDPFGRRIEKKVEQSNRRGHHEHHGNTGEQTTRFLYDGQALIQESTIQGNHRAARPETVSYIHGPNIDEPLQGISHNKTWYYHADGLGSIVALTDKHGNVVQRYDYDSFGNLEQQGEGIEQPFTYTAREFDQETGLYYYRARYYDPQVGRFVSKDPIGFEGGDNNLYGYVLNNPVNWTDPYGKRVSVFTRSLDMKVKSGPYVHCVLIVEKCDGTKQTWDFQNDNEVYNPAKTPSNRIKNPVTTVVHAKNDLDDKVSFIADQMGHPKYDTTKYNCCYWVEDVLRKAGISWKNPNPWPAN